MEWINVKDRLPTNGQKVKFLHHGYEFTGDFFNKSSVWFFVGTQGQGKITTTEVTKWMSLPNPPEVEEDE